MARKISRNPPRRKPASLQKPAAARAATATARRPEEELVENFFLGILLFALAALVFIPVFHAGFIWDDDQLLTANPQVHSPNGWWTLWLKPETADYFPLTSTTLWLEWRLWGMNSGGYHVTNVILHATVSVLTWQTLKRLRIPGAWVAAAIFAVHPVCVESVAWISERKNTISQIFFLLSIIHYVRFEEKARTWRYVAAVACFTLALLAKTSVVMLPFILLMLAWWRHKELEPMRASYALAQSPVERELLLWSCVVIGVIAGGAWLPIESLKPNTHFNPLLGAATAIVGAAVGYAGGLALRKAKQWESFAGFELIRMLPFFLVAFLLGLVTVYFQYGRAIGAEEIPIGNLLQRTASASFAAGFYLYSALWPFNIIEIYPQWHRAFSLVVTQPTPHIDGPAPEHIAYWKQAIPGLILAGLLIYCWMRRERAWARALLIGLGTYIVAMLPALGFLTMSYMRLTLVADHFQYISIISVIAMVVAAGQTRAMKPAWLLLGALGFSLISYLNWDQTQDNHLAQALWIAGAVALAAAAMAPEYWKGVWRAFLVTVLLCFSIITWGQSGIYESEMTLWSATLEKNPYSWQAHNHLGAALYMAGNWRAAGPHFLQATLLKPENPESHNNLGLYYSMEGDMQDAIKQYETAVGIKDDSSMDTNLGNAYEQVKEYDKAIKEYEHAIALNPANASAHCNLGYALMQLGRTDEAIPHFMKTMEYDPTMPQGQADLIQALQVKGIDLSQPDFNRPYSFDLRKAIELLRNAPPLPPPGQMRR